MLTYGNIGQRRSEINKGLMEVTIDEVIEEKLVTKDEFYTKMDEVMGELQTIREEQTLQSHQLSDHSDRIEKIEAHLDMTSH
jgi:hypothetical protein